MLGRIVEVFLGYGMSNDPIQGTGVITKVVDEENNIVDILGGTIEYTRIPLQGVHYNSTPTVGCWCYPEDLEE